MLISVHPGGRQKREIFTHMFNLSKLKPPIKQLRRGGKLIENIETLATQPNALMVSLKRYFLLE